LTGALQRRKMICHVWFVTFVYSERYSGGSELLIIGERLLGGQTERAWADCTSVAFAVSRWPLVVRQAKSVPAINYERTKD
jgi:hypothetical protein